MRLIYFDILIIIISFIGNKNDYSNIYHQNKQFEINNKYENKGFDSEESKDAWIYER